MKRFWLRPTKDLGLIERLNHRLFEEYPLGSELERGQWWVLFDANGVPQGFCGGRPADQGGKLWFLSRAGILTPARGLHLQRRMIRRRVQAAKEQGAKAVITYTGQYNIHSSNNLIACGFRLYEPSSWWAGKEMLYWWLNL